MMYQHGACSTIQCRNVESLGGGEWGVKATLYCNVDCRGGHNAMQWVGSAGRKKWIGPIMNVASRQNFDNRIMSSVKCKGRANLLGEFLMIWCGGDQIVRFPDPLGKWVGRTNPPRAGNLTSEASSTEHMACTPLHGIHNTILQHVDNARTLLKLWQVTFVYLNILCCICSPLSCHGSQFQ